MKQIIIVLSILFMHTQCMAQLEIKNQTNFKIKTLIGYEYNYLKSTNKLFVNDELLNEKDLISSSFYQDINLTFRHQLKWNKNQLITVVSPKYKAYYQNVKDSYFNLYATSKYKYHLSQKVKVLAGASFRKIIRDGFDSDQDNIVSPLGFTNVDANTGLQWQGIKNNKTETLLLYQYRDFDSYNNKDAFYHQIGLGLNTEQFFIINNQIHILGFTGFYKKTYYKTINTTDETLNFKRKWDLLKLNPYYTFNINKNIEATPSYQYFSRIDTESNTGFTQTGPELKLKLKQSKSRLVFLFSHLNRKYKYLEAQNAEGVTGEKIQLKFLKLSLIAVHELSKSISLNANLFSRIRTTNYTNYKSRTYGHFTNQYAAIGIEWKI